MAAFVSKNLRDEHFVPGLPEADKFEIIERLVTALRERHMIPLSAVTSVLDSVIRQERADPSGMELGLALPHGRSEMLPSSTLVIGLAPGGVDFDAADGSVSHVIVLSLEGRQEYPSLLREGLTDLLRGDPALVERLGRAESGADARALLHDAEAERESPITNSE